MAFTTFKTVSHIILKCICAESSKLILSECNKSAGGAGVEVLWTFLVLDLHINRAVILILVRSFTVVQSKLIP